VHLVWDGQSTLRVWLHTLYLTTHDRITIQPGSHTTTTIQEAQHYRQQAAEFTWKTRVLVHHHLFKEQTVIWKSQWHHWSHIPNWLYMQGHNLERAIRS